MIYLIAVFLFNLSLCLFHSTSLIHSILFLFACLVFGSLSQFLLLLTWHFSKLYTPKIAIFIRFYLFNNETKWNTSKMFHCPVNRIDREREKEIQKKLCWMLATSAQFWNSIYFYWNQSLKKKNSLLIVELAKWQTTLRALVS